MPQVSSLKVEVGVKVGEVKVTVLVDKKYGDGDVGHVEVLLDWNLVMESPRGIDMVRDEIEDAINGLDLEKKSRGRS